MKPLQLPLIVSSLKQIAKSIAFMAIFIALIEPVMAHGTVIWPKSRIKYCHENPTGNHCRPCGESVYSWRSILQPHTDYGKHRNYVPDGQLASGGNPEKYGCLDALISWPTQQDWKTTRVNYGDIFVKWHNTAPHRTEYYKVYITPLDWDPSKPLKWDDLIEIGHKGKGPAEDYTVIKATIPDSYIGKRAVIFSVWQREFTHSHEAFYSVSDIKVVRSGGGTSAENPGDSTGGGDGDGDGDGDGTGCDKAKAWAAEATYLKGDQATYQNNLFQAKWWTKGHNPMENSGPWQVWEQLKACPKTSGGSTASFELLSNQPNPFTNQSQIRFKVSASKEKLSLTISTLSNQLVKKLFVRKVFQTGTHTEVIKSVGLKPGVYLCVLKGESGDVQRRKILIK